MISNLLMKEKVKYLSLFLFYILLNFTLIKYFSEDKNMNPREFKEQLWFILNDFYPSKRHGTDLVSVRCPFCGDSVKSGSSTHFYIKISLLFLHNLV